MNRKLDGSELTRADLEQIARDSGIPEEKIQGVHAHHNTNLEMSALLSLTADARFKLFMKGELSLNTLDSWNSP